MRCRSKGAGLEADPLHRGSRVARIGPKKSGGKRPSVQAEFGEGKRMTKHGSLAMVLVCAMGAGCGGVVERELQADEIGYDNELMEADDVWAALDKLADDGDTAKDRLGGHDTDLATVRADVEEAATDRAAIREELKAHRSEPRTITRVAGYGNDDLNEGKIESRVLHFTKSRATTGLRVSYVDNFRVLGTGVACSWEIRFDDLPCTSPGPLRFDSNVSNGSGSSLDNHAPGTVFGTCFDIPAGDVTIDVWVTHDGHRNPQGNCFTGWNSQYWSLEVEEVW